MAQDEEESSSPVAGAAYGVLASLIWAGFPAITKLSMASALTAWDVTALRFGTAYNTPCDYDCTLTCNL